MQRQPVGDGSAQKVYSAPHGRPGSASRSCCSSGHVSGRLGCAPPCRRRHRSRLRHDPLQGRSLRSWSKVRTRTWRDSGAGISKAGTGRGAAIPDSHDGEFHALCQERCRFEWPRRTASSTSRLTDTASCESLRLKLVELGLGDRSRVEELFGRRDLIGARAATARGGD